MTPEPAARPSSRGARRRKKRSKSSGPKNSRNRSSISGEGPSSCAASGLSFTLTLTTDGVARSATETKASSSARSSALESGAGAGAAGRSAGRDWARAVGATGNEAIASRSTIASTPRRIVVMRGLRGSSYRRVRGPASRLPPRLERELEHARGRGGDGGAAAPPHSRDPHDVAAHFDQRGARPLPARNARVDQERLQAAQARRAEGGKDVAAAARADRERARQQVRVEGGARGLPRDHVVGVPREHTRGEPLADLRHVELSRPRPPARGDRGERRRTDPQPAAAPLDHEPAESHRPAPRRLAQQPAERALGGSAEGARLAPQDRGLPDRLRGQLERLGLERRHVE